MGSKVDRQSQEEVARQAKIFQPTQQIPKPICDRSLQSDNKQEVFVDKNETSSFGIIEEKFLHEELCSSDPSGQPDITPSVIEARNLYENTRVEQTHDGSGQLDERNSSSAHTAQTNFSGEIRIEQTHDRWGQPEKNENALRAAPEVHREITTLNVDNKLTRERLEEDKDFKIPKVPHSIVK